MIDPEQLLQLARRELAAGGHGAPRQVNLRRAGSTAYYAVFHALCNEIANTFWKSNGEAWNLFYRALDHGATRQRCESLDPRLAVSFQDFAHAFVELQQFRNRCDYDPVFRITKAALDRTIRDAADAIAGLREAGGDRKVEFLAYLLLGRKRKP